MKLKQQKELLLKQVDREIRKATQQIEIYLQVPKERKLYSDEFLVPKTLKYSPERYKEEVKRERTEKTQINFKKTEFMIFKIDSGTQYKIVKSKEALNKFKEIINSKFPTSDSNNGDKIYKPSMKQKGIRPTLNVSDNGELNFEYIRPYKPCRITSKNFNLRTAKNEHYDRGYKLRYRNKWFSNGHYMVKGRLPEGLDKDIKDFRDRISQDFLNRNIDDTGYRPAKIEIEAHKRNTIKYLVLIQRGDVKITLDAIYTDLIMSYYPDAVSFISTKHINKDKVLFKSKEGVVAICMRGSV